jgi:secreted trypsin-like serine protease
MHVQIAVAEGRLVGATEAVRGQFPWQAEIRSIIGEETVKYCSGSMISKDYIITSAECIPE